MERGDIVEYVDGPGSIRGMAGSIGVVVKSADDSISTTIFVRWMVQLGVLPPLSPREREIGAPAHGSTFLKVIGHADQ